MLLSSPLLCGLLHLAVLVPFVLISRPALKDRGVRWLAAAATIYLLYTLLSSGLAGLELFSGQQWNWAGKGLILLGGLIFLIRNRAMSLRECGLTLKQNSGSVQPVLILMLLTITIRLAVYFLLQQRNWQVDNETLLFQATLSPICDELIFRGIIIALLNRLYNGAEDFAGFPLSWPILLSSILFGLSQGLLIQNGLEIQINLVRILFALFAALVAGMMKERSGSLLFPVIFHALWNIISNH